MAKKYNFGQVSNKISNNCNEIICILDGSSSMSALKKSTVDGFNEFLLSQKNKNRKKKTYLTVVIFHSKNYTNFGNFGNFGTYEEVSNNAIFDVLYNKIDIKEAELLTYNAYRCDGMTPLFDAVGEVISKVSNNKTLCLIMTDGEENYSKMYNSTNIKNMIEAKKELGWSFVFIGANMTSFKDYNNIGLGGFTISMSNTEQGYKDAWNCMSNIYNTWEKDNKLTKSSLNANVELFSSNLSTNELK